MNFLINKTNIVLAVSSIGLLLVGIYDFNKSSTYQPEITTLQSNVTHLKTKSETAVSEMKTAKRKHKSVLDTANTTMQEIVNAENVVVKYNNDHKSVTRDDYQNAKVILNQYIPKSKKAGWNPVKNAWFTDTSYTLSYHLGSTMNPKNIRVEFVITQDKGNTVMGVLTAKYNVSLGTLHGFKSYSTSAARDLMEAGD